MHQVRVDVGLGGGVTQSVVVYGRALRDLRLVLSGVAAEVQARLSGEMGHTANLDTCIAYAEQKAAAVE